MIESIKIKSVATYNEIGIQINDLKKINFIYGGNGCGKTTISNFISESTDEKFNNCTLSWRANQPLKTIVYNKEFRDRNFGKGKITGVFTLGEATVEELQTLEEKTIQLNKIKNDGIQKSETLKKQEESKEKLELEFKESAWKNVYKKHENYFKNSFKNFHTKEGFYKKLLEEFKQNISDLQPFENLKEKAKTILGEQPLTISPIRNLSFERILELESNPIWSKIIIGKANVDIAKLIQKLNLNDWVNQGKDYIQEDTCPFCQQKTISEDFKTQIENYFDESYLQDIKLTKRLKEEYDFLIEEILVQLDIIESEQKDFGNTKLNTEKYTACLKTIRSQNATNRELLNNKIKEPSRSIDLVSVKEQFLQIQQLIEDANREIIIHNNIVLNFQSEKSKLIQSIWRYITNEFKKEIDMFFNSVEGFKKGIENLKHQIEEKRKEFLTLDKDVKQLSKNVTSTQPTILEMNRVLKSYGFLNFEIATSSEQGFYYIKRKDGTIAESTLSEGEITFITFLYYLQKAKGGDTKESVNDQRVLVVDDPISSLDSNILFVVSTLIKEIIKNIKADEGNVKQLILLTHNVYFHKEVSFVDGRTTGCNKTNFWVIRKNDSISTIQAYLNQNPIQSSYQLLWGEIKGWQNNSGITIQNTMRRIIENYFGILGKKRDDFLIGKFITKEDQEICRSLLSWINEGSHTMPDDLYVEAPHDIIGKYLAVFKEIFTHTDNIGHYNMMMGINEEIVQIA